MTVLDHQVARGSIPVDIGDERYFQVDRSLNHDVYAVIIEGIHEGVLCPGERISEAAIARRLGISRGPVREAISRLHHEGLITRRPRRGAIVSEFTDKELKDIASTRQLIEGHAARYACQLLTAKDIVELERLIDSMESAAREERWTKTASLNSSFHQTVVRIANNKMLMRLWQTLHPLAWLLAQASSPFMPHEPASLVARHRALLDALKLGDPDSAEYAFRNHIAEASRSKTGPLPT